MNAKLMTALMALALSACGGGGGSSSGGSTSSVASTAQSSSSSVASSESTEFNEIMGLYDASSGVDNNYYYIDSSGTLTAYNYLGDGADAGDNCYREAVEDDVNADITGSSLNAESSGDYSIDIGGNTVTLEMTGDEITRISAGGISAGGSMALTLGGVSFRLTPDRATDLSIDDITSMMCE